MPGRINGFSLAYTAIGGVVLWSGIKGSTLSATFKNLLSGQAPTSGAEPVTTVAGGTDASSPTGSSPTGSGSTAPAGNTGADSTTAAANQAIGKMLAAPYGWSTGTQWADLVSLWNQESGWSNVADNPTSGAYGIPQALPYTKMPKAAWPPSAGGSASASSQISWGLSYIKSTYGSPEGAWAHEVADGWY